MNHLVPSPGLHKPATEPHASNSKTQKVDAGGFKINFGYIENWMSAWDTCEPISKGAGGG